MNDQISKINLVDEITCFVDKVAPHLDACEQAIFFHLFRRTHIIGIPETTISLRTARKTFGFGIGDRSKPMSENTLKRKIVSMESKGLLVRRDVSRKGTIISVAVPSETIFCHADPKSHTKQLTLEDIDFFLEVNARRAIIEREMKRCFYCFRDLNDENTVMEHVVSRPTGDNSYRNIVAACRDCNNRKGAGTAHDHLVLLYRTRRLSDNEFDDRVHALELLSQGRLKPDFPDLE